MESPLGKPDLLIVDDDPLISDTLNFVLSRDFNVYVAESRAQVKSLLRQLDSSPRLDPVAARGCSSSSRFTRRRDGAPRALR